MISELLPNIHLLGIQGSGKGTQAALLASAKSLTVLPTGELFRHEAARETALGIDIKSRLASGELMTTEELCIIVTQFLSHTSIAHGLIGDGAIRTLDQAVTLEPIWAAFGLDRPYIVHFELSPDQAWQRIIQRRTERGQPRTDDHDEAIQRRLAIYAEHNHQILTRYQQDNRVYSIAANQSIDSIAHSVAQKVAELYPQL